jgi:hypothetical protein
MDFADGSWPIACDRLMRPVVGPATRRTRSECRPPVGIPTVFVALVRHRTACSAPYTLARTVRLRGAVTSHSPRLVALVLALTWFAGSAVHAQTSGRDHHLTVSVTVSPICTVAVTPGEQTDDGAVDVQCRNLAEGQPEPEIDDAGPVIEDGSTVSDGSVRLIVINF